MELAIHDVPGDGNCFYVSVATALAASQPLGAIDTRELASDLRMILADSSEGDERELVEKMLVEVKQVCYQDEDVNCYLADTAVERAHESSSFSCESLASFMRLSTSFASFIDVELMRVYLARRRILVLVFGSKESLENRADWDRMIEAEGRRCADAKRLLVLLNIEGRHYNWVSVDSKSIPSLRHF